MIFIVKLEATMNSLTLESYSLRCRIDADKSLLDSILEDPFTYHYMIRSRRVENGYSDVQIKQDDSIQEPVEIDYPNARFKSDLSSRDIIVVGEYLLERARQEKLGFYTISSACARLDNLAVVFNGGATNLGKTSSMLTLVQRCGFEFVSDEKTLIDLQNMKIGGGSISIPTRKKIIRESFFSEKSESLSEYEKIAHNEGSFKAGLMIYPHLDHGLPKPIYYKWQPLDAFWILTRDFSHEIRGGIRLVNNFSHILSSIDNPELSKSRIERTRMFCENVPCYYFQGSLDQVAEYIPNLLRQENA